jgi:hypothetical protein
MNNYIKTNGIDVSVNNMFIGYHKLCISAYCIRMYEMLTVGINANMKRY